MHIPVLLNEIMELAHINPGETVIDGTLDGGGYARASLEALQHHGIFMGIDWDESMIHKTGEELKKQKSSKLNVITVHGNFKDMPRLMKEHDIHAADVVMLDLGFSSLQLQISGRGFSFMEDEPLIMTYSDESVPVRKILKELKEDELASIFKEIGEERFAKRIAKGIKERLRKSSIETTQELVQVIKESVPGHYERGRIHPATRVFMALRIYANHEFENLTSLLEVLPNMMRSGGRVLVVSFHSQEDRIVKQAFRDYAKTGVAQLLTKKPIVPSQDEIRNNPRSRSAKLRGLLFV